jgi:peptidoglycan/LPS O-acetylase OafA/YrhL
LFIHRPQWGNLAAFVKTDAIVLGVMIAKFSHTPVYRIFEPRLENSRFRYLIPAALLFCLFAVTRYEIVSFYTGIAAIVSALLVWLASYQKGYLFRPSILRNALSWIGARSYAIYLVHIPSFAITQVIFSHIEPPGTRFDSTYTLRFTITALALTLGVADLNFRFVEEPLRRKGKKRADALTASSGEAVDNRHDI